MKVLIVDDDPLKMRQMATFIRTRFPLFEIQERRSYQSGLKAALLDEPDIIVLDMSMPTHDVGGKEKGTRERRYAGFELLRQLKRKNKLALVVVVTQFEHFGEGENLITLEELSNELKQAFPEVYIGAIHYQATESRWMEQLESLLNAANIQKAREEK